MWYLVEKIFEYYFSAIRVLALYRKGNNHSRLSNDGYL